MPLGQINAKIHNPPGIFLIIGTKVLVPNNKDHIKMQLYYILATQVTKNINNPQANIHAVPKFCRIKKIHKHISMQVSGSFIIA